MKITVSSETTISIEVSVERDGAKSEGILEMDGGEWRLNRTPQGGSFFIAQGRVEWPEALKRALIALSGDTP